MTLNHRRPNRKTVQKSYLTTWSLRRDDLLLYQESKVMMKSERWKDKLTSGLRYRHCRRRRQRFSPFADRLRIHYGKESYETKVLSHFLAYFAGIPTRCYASLVYFARTTSLAVTELKRNAISREYSVHSGMPLVLTQTILPRSCCKWRNEYLTSLLCKQWGCGYKNNNNNNIKLNNLESRELYGVAKYFYNNAVT